MSAENFFKTFPESILNLAKFENQRIKTGSQNCTFLQLLRKILNFEEHDKD